MIAFGYALVKVDSLHRLVEERDRAEGALMVLTAGLAREDEISELDRRMHLHAAHLDVVEKRIDGVKKDLVARNEALAGDLELAHESLVGQIHEALASKSEPVSPPCKKKHRKMVKK